MLTINGVTVRLGGRAILERASATIPPKARVGLVGRNGTGKSTLLKVIAGVIEPDAGAVETPRGTRIGYIAQEAPGGAATPFETVLAADTERARLLAEAEHHQTEPHALAEIHARLSAIEAHSAPARAARILAGLGFDDAAQNRPLDSFSGGWRMRVALAALLFTGPDLLLLDEPSNHLDLEATLWLESFIKAYRATVIVVSHERDLLNTVVDNTLHLEAGRLTLYAGGYDQFERQRRERQAQAESQRKAQDARRQKLQAYVDRWRYKAHTARQAQSRLKALARMEPVAAAVEDPSLTFDFPSPDALKPPLITLDGAAVGYAGTPVLTRLNLRIDPDDRIALLGRNGNGKTTLARLLSRELSPMAGSMNASGKLRVGYFAQHQVESLEAEDTPLMHMTRAMPADAKPTHVRAQLGRFGFSGEKAEVRVGRLSGGERARLALALITREAPHLLILDEPTNHLDVDAREALVQALNEYDGAVIVVSHDRHLLELTADRLVLVGDGTARPFDGSLDDYRDMVLSASPAETAADKPRGPSRKDARRAAAEARERTQALRKAVKDAEKEMERLTARRTEIDRALFDPASYEGPHKAATVTELMKLRGDVERQLAAAEARWLAAGEALEAAETT